MVAGVTLAPDGGSRAVDALAAHAAQPRSGGAATGDRCRRRDVEQRTQHEGALVHARMRDGQIGLGDACVAVQQQVEVERARRVRPAARAARP